MKKAILLIMLIPVVFGACTKNLTSLNDNPKAPITAPSTAVFLAGEKALVDIYTADNWNAAPFRVISQVWTMNTYNNITHYQFATDNPSGGWWNALYTSVLSNLYQAKLLYAADVPDSGVRKNDLLVTDILEVYAYSLLVNTFGNVPYSQALDRNIPFPVYDDAKTIEYDLLKRLDTAINGLDPAYGSLGLSDQLYKGDVARWKKFAATLKLKLALYLADTDPSTAAVRAKEAIAAGVFSSNSDNALLPYDASSVAGSNPVWQDLVNGNNLHYYSPASYFINTLKADNDPRLPLLFTKYPTGGY